jgi:hypothetical protein
VRVDQREKKESAGCGSGSSGKVIGEQEEGGCGRMNKCKIKIKGAHCRERVEGEQMPFAME